MRQEDQELKIILDSVLSLSPSLGCLRPVSPPSKKEGWSEFLTNKQDTVKTPIPVSLGDGSRDRRVWLFGPSESRLELVCLCILLRLCRCPCGLSRSKAPF